MCDIKTVSKLKKVIIYKQAFKIGGLYYSIFAGTPIQIGPAVRQTHETRRIAYARLPVACNSYEGIDSLYNVHMVGKCSGFYALKNAQILGQYQNFSTAVTLKIVLEGEIMKGTAANVGGSVPPKAIVYAGTIIKSIEEVK